MSIDSNYQKACELMDMDSAIDYFATQLYISRSNDWPAGYSNTALWRTREIGSGEYEDGRWRWMMFDVNSGAMTRNLVDFDSITHARNSCPLFDNLCKNQEFVEKLVDKIIEIGLVDFSYETVMSKIDNYVNELQEPMLVHNKRFWGTDNEVYYENIDSIRFFYQYRFDNIVSILKENFPNIDIDYYVNMHGK